MTRAARSARASRLWPPLSAPAPTLRTRTQREWRQRRALYARVPFRMVAVGSFDHVEEARLQPLGDRTDFAVADGAVVDLAHGRDFRRSPGEEAFVGEVKRVARDALFENRNALFAGEREHGVARDASEDGPGEGRRDEATLLDDENVFARAFAHVALRIEKHSLVVPARFRFGLREHGVRVLTHRFGLGEAHRDVVA